jgi:hypothetical protein
MVSWCSNLVALNTSKSMYVTLNASKFILLLDQRHFSPDRSRWDSKTMNEFYHKFHPFTLPKPQRDMLTRQENIISNSNLQG